MQYRSLFVGALCSVALSAGAAVAADLPIRSPAPAPAPVVAVPLFSWTGFYVGVNVGYGGDKFEYPFGGEVFIGPGFTYGGKPSITSSGFLGGVQAGYNWQFANNWVVGVEADYQWSNIEGRVNINGAVGGIGNALITAGSEISGFGTVRARLGYSWDRALLYVTGGWAYGSVDSGANIAVCGAGGGGCLVNAGISRDNNLSSGWAAGFGIEYALTSNLSFKTEYLFVDLGSGSLYSADYGFATARLDVDAKVHVVRGGLNYRFGWGGAAPVVARY